jgi:hypothetical protein
VLAVDRRGARQVLARLLEMVVPGIPGDPGEWPRAMRDAGI